MSIAAVALDYGNVISEAQDPSAVGLMAAIADVDETAFSKALWDLRPDYDTGKYAGPEYFRAVLGKIGRSVDDGVLAALVRADLESWASLNQAAVELMAAVKKAGVKTAILSNMPQEFLALARKRFPVFGTADAAVVSCELKIVKPDPAIYRTLVERLAIPAGDIVFFDDAEINVAAARTAGLVAELWTGATAARTYLAGRGLVLA